MSRLLVITGYIGTEPEAKHGKSSDYVKFRFSTKEPGESETWWFNVLCYGHDAKIALDKFKVKDYMQVAGRLLPPLKESQTSPTIVLIDFKWLRQDQPQPQKETKEGFDFDIFDEIPEIPFGS